MAAKRIQELETYKRIMVRRNGEIEEKLTANGIVNVESTKVRIEVANPTSGMDPMVDILKCLKSLGAKTRSVQSQISDQQLTAVMDIETEVIPFSLLLSNNGHFIQAKFDAACHVWLRLRLLVERIGNKDTIFHVTSVFTSSYLFLTLARQSTRASRLWPRTAPFFHPWNERVNFNFLRLLMLTL